MFTDKHDQSSGVYRKFKVERTDGTSAPGGRHEGCEYFVLDTQHDPHAPAALLAYADSCEKTHPVLAADVRKMAAGERVLGTEPLVAKVDFLRRKQAVLDLLSAWDAMADERAGSDEEIRIHAEQWEEIAKVLGFADVEV